MSSRRVLKAAEAIREVVSMAILTDLKDPRVKHVTVTRVEVAGDMRQAKVLVSVMGDERQQNLTLHGLQSAAGYLQKKISDRIDTRYTPRLQFELDQGVKKSIEIAQILRTVLPNDATGGDRAEVKGNEGESMDDVIDEDDDDLEVDEDEDEVDEDEDEDDLDEDEDDLDDDDDDFDDDFDDDDEDDEEDEEADEDEDRDLP